MGDEIRKADASEFHPDYPGLTRVEVEAAKRRASEKIAKERKQEALNRIAEQEEINLRAAMGETERTMREVQNLSPVNRETVELTLNLAPQMPDIRLDGVIYRNRGTYKVSRAKAMEILKIQFEGWRHESVRMGQDSYAFYAQQAQSQRPPLVINTAQGIISGSAPRGTH